MKELVVIGASGFVGKNLVLAAQNVFDNIICVVRRSKPMLDFLQENKLKKYEILELGDFNRECSLKKLHSLFKEHMCIINCAWDVTPGEYINSSNNYISAKIALDILEIALERRVQKFIGLGTCAEYADSNKKLSPHSNLDPKSIYASSKALTGLASYKLAKETETDFSWARLFYLKGRFESKGRLFKDLSIAFETGKQIDLSDCSQVKDYIDIDQAAVQLVKLCFVKDLPFVNICCGLEKSVLDHILDTLKVDCLPDNIKLGVRPRNVFDPDYLVGEVCKDLI